MKYIALILSFILFNQSLTVCTPSVIMSANSQKEATCISKEAFNKNGDSKSCCEKKTDSSEHQSHDDGCCDDGCKCLCCVKAFVIRIDSDDQKAIENKIIIDRVISPILFNSFDFHQTIITPPKRK